MGRIAAVLGGALDPRGQTAGDQLGLQLRQDARDIICDAVVGRAVDVVVDRLFDHGAARKGQALGRVRGLSARRGRHRGGKRRDPAEASCSLCHLMSAFHADPSPWWRVIFVHLKSEFWQYQQ
jgi:hypothetical protein